MYYVIKIFKLLVFVLYGGHDELLIHSQCPVKIVTGIFSFFTAIWSKITSNPIIFLANAMETPWLELVQNPCHAWARRTNKIWTNDMEWSWNLVWIWSKLPPISEITWNFQKNPDLAWSKSTPNSMTSPCHLSRFYLFSMEKHDMDFGQLQVMEFPWHLLRKWWDFHRIRSHFRPNCRQKDMRKSVSHFLQGCTSSQM